MKNILFLLGFLIITEWHVHNILGDNMKIWKNTVLGYIGGMVYVALELIWRGWSHGSMFLVGGICFLLICAISAVFPEMPLLMQSVLGACMVTAIELISGLFLNVFLQLNVWDYSALPYNFMGQVCMSYFFLWILVSFGAIWANRLLRMGLFHEKAWHFHKKSTFPHKA